ncbi:MAG TPA: PEP/pyruvate-binding domain-containing protein [Candidatus Paceibacterota bacterium]|nr:PEP/pyruvate-binding domain-containing protein [Candidatus Pacearchaeota archaeon]HRZ51371.1 PEP/pyruvate-binding domain-containing protein [Candidatus Paceibacterota bacterium]HSA37093.1 PEP/pyruvate-binding domain-containing protein [Candidatus Paceibacterota bacterium]
MIENYKYIRFFGQISGKDAKTAGGKAANLARLVRAGIPVPNGFAILAPAFLELSKASNIGEKIEAVQSKIDAADAKSVKTGSEAIKRIIMAANLADLGIETLAAFAALGAKLVSVRSSATSEDSKSDSWAGQLETNLNVAKPDLIEKVKKSWASLYGERALQYAAEKKLDGKTNSVAVIVQAMIKPEVSGVCFTVHPVTNSKKQMVIESVWGLGESLVQGAVTPDRYLVSRPDLTILDVNANSQDKMIAKTARGSGWIKVPKSKRLAQKLSGFQIVELCRLCLKIEKLYKAPQDIEWARTSDGFCILQTRPITTFKN